MSRANGITRQEILTSIKYSGAMTAEELARELGISQVAVRQHLASLEAEGSVTVTVERRGLGRPSHRYRLTVAGDETFPRHYATIATEMLDALLEWQGAEAVETLLAKRRQQQLAQLEPRLKGKPLATQLLELARYQTEAGYMAEVVPEETGGFRLITHNCSACAVARRYPNICCEGEIRTFQQVLGNVEIAREHYILDGDSTCTFRIHGCQPADPEA